jgi:hypothetical protein
LVVPTETFHFRDGGDVREVHADTGNHRGNIVCFFYHYYLIKTYKSSSDDAFITEEEEEKEKDDNKNSYGENWIIIEWNLLMRWKGQHHQQNKYLRDSTKRTQT